MTLTPPVTLKIQFTAASKFICKWAYRLLLECCKVKLGRFCIKVANCNLFSIIKQRISSACSKKDAMMD